MSFEKFSAIYILCSKKNGTLYVGVTNNLTRRIFEHKNKLIQGFTKKYKIDKLVYYECYQFITDAIAREKKIKHLGRSTKISLIEAFNKEWRDLYDDIIQ